MLLHFCGFSIVRPTTGKPRKVKIKSQLKIELSYQKEHFHYYIYFGPPSFSPLLDELGPRRAQNGIFGDFNSNFGGFPKFTSENECAYQIQQAKIFKVANFQTSAKIYVILLPSVIERWHSQVNLDLKS